MRVMLRCGSPGMAVLAVLGMSGLCGVGLFGFGSLGSVSYVSVCRDAMGSGLAVRVWFVRARPAAEWSGSHGKFRKVCLVRADYGKAVKVGQCGLCCVRLWMVS